MMATAGIREYGNSGEVVDSWWCARLLLEKRRERELGTERERKGEGEGESQGEGE